jgi:4-carboxymuconolactone decarboxylase
MTKPVPGDNIRDLAPFLADLSRDVVYGTVWERPEISKRDRCVVTLSALIAMNRLEQLTFHINRALDHGVTKTEIIEIISHLAFYSGWPNSVSAIGIARKVFEARP